MGTHFAPPFAVIFMDYIENIALSTLEAKNIKPFFYKRYIDDILLGPFPKRMDVFDEILEAFNQVHEKIKFTIEIPSKALNFLDMSLWIEDNVVRYKYYSKEIRSDNCLNKSSWVPCQIKKNFVNNYINTAKKRCSSDLDKKEAEGKIKLRLKKNGYTDNDFNRYCNTRKRRCKYLNTSVGVIAVL